MEPTVLDALVRIREALERWDDELLADEIPQHAANEQAWGEALKTAPWAHALAKLTNRQRWLLRELWDQSRDALSRTRAHREAGRITEARTCLAEYAQRFDTWARLHKDLYIAAHSGLPTENIGAAVVPPCIRETLAEERDDKGRLLRVVERRM